MIWDLHQLYIITKKNSNIYLYDIEDKQFICRYKFTLRIKHTVVAKNNEFLFVLITNDKDLWEVHVVDFKK